MPVGWRDLVSVVVILALGVGSFAFIVSPAGQEAVERYEVACHMDPAPCEGLGPSTMPWVVALVGVSSVAVLLALWVRDHQVQEREGT